MSTAVIEEPRFADFKREEFRRNTYDHIVGICSRLYHDATCIATSLARASGRTNGVGAGAPSLEDAAQAVVKAARRLAQDTKVEGEGPGDDGSGLSREPVRLIYFLAHHEIRNLLMAAVAEVAAKEQQGQPKYQVQVQHVTDEVVRHVCAVFVAKEERENAQGNEAQ